MIIRSLFFTRRIPNVNKKIRLDRTGYDTRKAIHYCTPCYLETSSNITPLRGFSTRRRRRRKKDNRKKERKPQGEINYKKFIPPRERNENIKYSGIPISNPNYFSSLLEGATEDSFVGQEGLGKIWVECEKPKLPPLVDDFSPLLKIGTGVVAPLCDASVMGVAGSTVVHSTVSVSEEDISKEMDLILGKSNMNIRFTVDYHRRHHGIGNIPTNHTRTDYLALRPTEEEILASRAIDRSLRPLVSNNSKIHVACTVQSFDYQSSCSGDPVALAINTASAALFQTMKIYEPCAAIRLCLLHNGRIIVNPNPFEIENSKLQLLYAGTRYKSLMIEAFCGENTHYSDSLTLDSKYLTHDSQSLNDTSEETLAELLNVAHALIQPIIDAQERFQTNLKTENKKETWDLELIRKTLDLPNENPTKEVEDITKHGLFNHALKTFGLSNANTKEKEDLIQHDLFSNALNFIQEKCHQSFLKIFAPDINEPNIQTLLKSKKFRGIRENVMFQEVDHRIRTEYQPLKKSHLFRNEEHLKQFIDSIFKTCMKQAMIEAAMKSCRSDGRNRLDEIRDINVQVPVLPENVHGSAFFSRGETQVLCTTTLGAPKLGKPLTSYSLKTTTPNKEKSQASDELPVGSLRFLRTLESLVSDLNSKRSIAAKELLDSGTQDEVRRAYLQYDFPDYSTGSTPSKMRNNRRVIGHGNLAEKAILPTLPSPAVFPYAIRLTSEVTASNGSSSMASVCGATLSLLDAGVPIREPVVGVSVGLVYKGDSHTHEWPNDSYALLLDITGTEDHYGGMDFKIAGSRDNITAMQLDVKVEGGVPLPVLIQALKLAKQGRSFILESMNTQSLITSQGFIDNLLHRPFVKTTAPRVEIIHFDPVRKKNLIGPGGAVLRQLEDRFDVSVDVSQEGQCILYGDNNALVGDAKVAVMDLVSDIIEGEIYEGTVIEIKDFGAIIELLRNKEGLLHVSELTDNDPLKHPDGTYGLVHQYLKVGQKIQVLCIGVDPVQGSIKLSYKKLNSNTRLSTLN